MSGGFRTRTGGRVDRGREIRFRFDGKSYTGLAGDTLATALIAQGVHLMGRSFKYHRPRGPISLGSDEPNALVTLDAGAGRRTPNLRATQLELYDGLTAFSQNAWPSLGFDAMAVNGYLSAFLPAGFYYKTFMSPHGAWESLYEPMIRRAAGLGVAPTEPDPDRYAFEHRHCEVAVIGAGPAGLAAALGAARDQDSWDLAASRERDLEGSDLAAGFSALAAGFGSSASAGAAFAPALASCGATGSILFSRM